MRIQSPMYSQAIYRPQQGQNFTQGLQPLPTSLAQSQASPLQSEFVQMMTEVFTKFFDMVLQLLNNKEAASIDQTPKGIGSSGEFLWKPDSESDGKLVILLPSGLTGNVAGVEVRHPESGRLLATGRFSGVKNGGREHFRFSKGGEEFPPGSVVKITLRDGSVRTVSVPKPAQRFTK